MEPMNNCSAIAEPMVIVTKRRMLISAIEGNIANRVFMR
jgi:hypothetical protein